jgi:diguanylate cyclase (GGDEF)-like protein
MASAALKFDALIQFLYRAEIGLVQTAPDGVIQILNPAAARLLLPLSRDGALLNLFTILAEVAPRLRAEAAAFAAPSGIVCESRRLHLCVGVADNVSPQTLSLSLLKVDESRLMAMVSDVTQQAAREQRLQTRRRGEAARSDTLLRILERAEFCARMQELIDRAHTGDSREFAVLFLNCDRFRRINETLGHRVGDEVLHLMGERLRSIVRAQDDLGRTQDRLPFAARITGDEFVVVLDALNHPDDVHAVAQRLLDRLSKPYGIGDHKIHCSVSLGLVLRAHAEGDADAVIRKASIAMVEAKRTGGGRSVTFEPWMQERATHRSDIEVALRHALAEDELFVMYQPIVWLPGNTVSSGGAGVEALVRWRHPTRGLIPPLDFISVAEECGLIGAVGDFVLSSACHQFAEWRRTLGARAPQLLAVNLSRAQLLRPELVETVASILQSSGVPARQLQLEVTESLAAQDERVQRHLHSLKSLSLTLALDDFGTGYSSLASLHQLPIDTVKIDRSFVSQVDSSQHHRVLIEATVRVAKSLGMHTVAEGIETREQAAVVQMLGCEKGQGYLFSKPLNVAEVPRWLTRREPAFS